MFCKYMYVKPWTYVMLSMIFADVLCIVFFVKLQINFAIILFTVKLENKSYIKEKVTIFSWKPNIFKKKKKKTC